MLVDSKQQSRWDINAGESHLDQFVRFNQGPPEWLSSLFARTPTPRHQVAIRTYDRANKRFDRHPNRQIFQKIPSLITVEREGEIPILHVMSLIAPLGYTGGDNRTQMLFPGARFLSASAREERKFGIVVVDELAFRALHIILRSEDVEKVLPDIEHFVNEIIDSRKNWRIAIHMIEEELLVEKVARELDPWLFDGFSLVAKWGTFGENTVKYIDIISSDKFAWRMAIPDIQRWNSQVQWSNKFQMDVFEYLQGSAPISRWKYGAGEKEFSGDLDHDLTKFRERKATPGAHQPDTNNSPREHQGGTMESTNNIYETHKSTEEAPSQHQSNTETASGQQRISTEGQEVVDRKEGALLPIEKDTKNQLTIALARLETAKALGDPGYLATCYTQVEVCQQRIQALQEPANL